MPKQKISKEKLIRILIWVSIIAISFIAIYALRLIAAKPLGNISNAFKSVFIPFAIAFFLSFIIGPFASLIENKLKMKRFGFVQLLFNSYIQMLAVNMVHVLGLNKNTLTQISETFQ